MGAHPSPNTGRSKTPPTSEALNLQAPALSSPSHRSQGRRGTRHPKTKVPEVVARRGWDVLGVKPPEGVLGVAL